MSASEEVCHTLLLPNARTNYGGEEREEAQNEASLKEVFLFDGLTWTMWTALVKYKHCGENIKTNQVYFSLFFRSAPLLVVQSDFGKNLSDAPKLAAEELHKASSPTNGTWRAIPFRWKNLPPNIVAVQPGCDTAKHSQISQTVYLMKRLLARHCHNYGVMFTHCRAQNQHYVDKPKSRHDDSRREKGTWKSECFKSETQTYILKHEYYDL